MGDEELAFKGDDNVPSVRHTTDRFWASPADAFAHRWGFLVAATDEGRAGKLDLIKETAAGDLEIDAKAGEGLGVGVKLSGRPSVEGRGGGIKAAKGGLDILDWDVFKAAVLEVEQPVEVLAEAWGVPTALVSCLGDASGISGFNTVSTCFETWRQSCFFSSLFSTGSTMSCNSSLCSLDRGSLVLPLPMRQASPTEMSSFSSVLMVSCLNENAAILEPLATEPGNTAFTDFSGSAMGLTSFETSIKVGAGTLDGSSTVGITFLTTRRTTFTTFLRVKPWSSGKSGWCVATPIGLILPLKAALPFTILPFTFALAFPSPFITSFITGLWVFNGRSRLRNRSRVFGGGSGLLKRSGILKGALNLDGEGLLILAVDSTGNTGGGLLARKSPLPGSRADTDCARIRPSFSGYSHRKDRKEI